MIDREFTFEKMVAPVFVNLVTAFVLFWSVYLFRDPIINTFFERPAVNRWPVHVALDAYNNDAGKVVVELLVINLEDHEQTDVSLEGRLNDLQSGEDVTYDSPHIKIYWNPSVIYGDPSPGILSVKPDEMFNGLKGDFAIELTDDGHWHIRIERIDRGQAVRFIATTELDRDVQRGTPYFNPVTIEYPGRKVGLRKTGS